MLISILLIVTSTSQQLAWAAPFSLRPLATGEGRPRAREKKPDGYKAHVGRVLGLLHTIQTGSEWEKEEASAELVRLQKGQERRKVEGRFITPIEIVIGQLRDERFYPRCREGIVKFFLDPRLSSNFRQRAIMYLISFADNEKKDHQALHIPMKWILHDVLVSMCKEAYSSRISSSKVYFNLKGYLEEIRRRDRHSKALPRRGGEKRHTKRQHVEPRTKKQSEIAKEMLNRIRDEDWGRTISSCGLTRHMSISYFNVLHKNHRHGPLQAFYDRNSEYRRNPVVSNILAGVTLNLLEPDKGGVTMNEADTILKFYLGSYREFEVDDLLSSLEQHLLLAGAIPQSPTLHGSAMEELSRSILRPLAAGEGKPLATKEKKAAPIPNEDGLRKDVQDNWALSIKKRNSVNPDAVNLAFGEALTAEEMPKFVTALISFKHPENIYLAPDEKLYGRIFWYSKETDTLYFARQAFCKIGTSIGPSEIIKLIGHIQRAIKSGHPDSAFIHRLSYPRRKQVQRRRDRRARVAAPASTVTPSITTSVTPSTPTETDEAISETEPALSESAKATTAPAAVSPLKELLYEMLDLDVIESRPLDEWIRLKDRLRGYFERGMSSFGIIFHKRPPVEIKAYKMALDGTEVALDMDEYTEDKLAKVKELAHKLEKGMRRGKRKASVGEAASWLKKEETVSRTQSRELVCNYATFAAALLKALISLGLDAGLPEDTQVPLFIENTLEWGEYWDAIRARYISQSRNSGYAYLPGHHALGFVTLKDEERKDVYAPISPKPILAARQIRFEPRVLSFPDIAEEIASDNVASVEYIAPEGENPPALVISFKKEVVIPAVPGGSMRVPSIAVLVLKEDWGRFPDKDVEKDLQKVESEPATVQALVFDKEADLQDRLDKTKALFDLSMANRLVARCGWQIESEEGAKMAAEFFGRTPDEKKAIYLQFLVWLKFSLIDNTVADKSRAKLREAEGTKRELEKMFDAHCRKAERNIAQFKKRVLDEGMTDEQKEAGRLLNFSPQVQEALKDNSNRQIRKFFDAIAKGELPEEGKAIKNAEILSRKLAGITPWCERVKNLAQAIARKRERQEATPRSPILQGSAKGELEHFI